jgi:homoserine dehydrogenase
VFAHNYYEESLNMSHVVKVALLGLGEVGETFAEHFLEKIQEEHVNVEIVAVASRHLDSPVAMGFSHSKVPVFKDAMEVVSLGNKVDIIFDLTGDPELRKQLRVALQESHNQHTVIAPEVVAQLLWNFFGEGELPSSGQTGY